MGKEIFYDNKGRRVQVEVLGREFGTNGYVSEERIYISGLHLELPGGQPHDGLSGEETVIIRPRGGFTMDGQLT